MASDSNSSPRVINCVSVSIVVTAVEMKLKFIAMVDMQIN